MFSRSKILQRVNFTLKFNSPKKINVILKYTIY